jgi:type II secretory pathway component PulF
MKLPNLSSEISLFEKVSLTDTLAFTKHICLMIKSGIPLPESILILSKQTSHSAFKKLLLKIHQEIANGQPLHKALSQFPHAFDAFYVGLIKVAEESGSLEKNLEYLAIHLKKQHEFTDKVKGALLYPSIILGVALVSGIGLSVFVLPKLIDLFASLDVELPLSTKILLWFAEIMRDYGIFLLGGLTLLIILIRWSITTKTVKPYWHSTLLSLPVMGEFLQNIQLASMFRNIGTMLTVGVHISTAIDAQYETTTNSVYKDYLEKIKTGIKKGASIEDTLGKTGNKFIPLIAVRMIGVGEKTGKLDETLTYLGDYFEDEVDNTSKNLSTVLEPIILIIVGLIVAFIAISIIGPIYQFTGGIKR